jgi:hypothetical protein
MINKIIFFTSFTLCFFTFSSDAFSQLTTRLELAKRTKPYNLIKFKPLEKIKFFTEDSKIIGVLTHKQDGNLFVQSLNSINQPLHENSIIKIPIQDIKAVQIYYNDKETQNRREKRTLGNIVLVGSAIILGLSVLVSASPDVSMPWENFALPALGIGIGLVINPGSTDKKYFTHKWRIY